VSPNSTLDRDIARADRLLREARDQWHSGIHDCCEALNLAAECLQRVRQAVKDGAAPADLNRKKLVPIQENLRLFIGEADAQAGFWRGLALFAAAEPSPADMKPAGWQGVA
jgi:hypothetical protein